ncbi:MAG: hypothetical protein K8T91_00035 [Planctomycetes bacterium]|nr:hypothetical protein [Planctomycetota bacterium]
MEAIAQLQHAYYLLKHDDSQRQNCIDWAIDRLQQDQEGDDFDIVRLVSANRREDVLFSVEKIIKTYLGVSALDDQLAAGKYIVSLHLAYKLNSETIDSLDKKFTTLYRRLDYPDWLVMLSRNCEYATDIADFLQPFEDEFDYVAGLWATANNLSDFEATYSRQISNQHDFKMT